MMMGLDPRARWNAVPARARVRPGWHGRRHVLARTRPADGPPDPTGDTGPGERVRQGLGEPAEVDHRPLAVPLVGARIARCGPMVLFFEPQLVLGLGVDAVLLWVVMSRAWAS